MTGNHNHSSDKKRTLGGNEIDFIPSKTWHGSKSGYYFGTADQGTGYYRDSKQQPPQKKKARFAAEDQNEVHTLLAQAEQQAASKKVVGLSVKGVSIATQHLQRCISENSVARSTHDRPEEYMDSEINLYEQITVLKGFAADTSLYESIVSSGMLNELFQLLLHDNVDLVSAVVTVFLEWMDPDLENVQQLSQIVLEDGAELLVDNLARMDSNESEDDDDDDDVGSGVQDILQVFVHLLEIDLQESFDESHSAAYSLCKATKLLSWLVDHIHKDSPYQSKSLEVLSYLAPQADLNEIIPNWALIPPYTSGFLNEKTDAEATTDAVELLLQIVANFRKTQPSNDTEVETLENACLILTSVLTYSPPSVQVFIDAQGIELVVRCLKERVYAGAMALPWLEFAASDSVVYKKASEKLVSAGALKYIFPLFLGRNLPKHYQKAASKKTKRDYNHKLERTTIRIFYGLVRHLDNQSPDHAKERVMAKFAGPDKIKRLVELLKVYEQKVRLAEYNFYKSDFEDTLEDSDDKATMIQLALLDAKLSAGGDILHRLAAISGFCCAGSKTCHEQILEQLHADELGISLVREVLEEFISVLGESQQQELLRSFLDRI